MECYIYSHYVLTGFDLHWPICSTLNCFHTGQGCCAANIHKWHLVWTDSDVQIVNHSVESRSDSSMKLCFTLPITVLPHGYWMLQWNHLRKETSSSSHGSMVISEGFSTCEPRFTSYWLPYKSQVTSLKAPGQNCSHTPEKSHFTCRPSKPLKGDACSLKSVFLVQTVNILQQLKNTGNDENLMNNDLAKISLLFLGFVSSSFLSLKIFLNLLQLRL